ncbi:MULTISPECIES: hypothetical protein [unclassified Rhizobacter]|uniref:hypothetical protein n=1 Tax=unclassified Rhizobacter TaxID=2640088 RepID=UPI0006FB7888|nr:MULTISPECIES: hypothetical protein [unclassified Rhizobacter]KQU78115.1 hypothetical protein ASC88_20030 [Rhizobacter sp. Root29]KQW15861.1 hypothetical protein ASC98_01250 [Rhizobacter sp. Root1238]KRB24974.1 hypothetical protein ASE08_01965 [Rhizobacter sp. Root16D2]
MTMTRKGFLGAAAGSTVMLFLQACGGGGSDYNGSPAPAPGPAPAPAPGPAPQSCGASNAAITGNHGHVLTIPTADLDSATAMTYDIHGAASHSHSVSFTPAQLQALKAGQIVVVTSTTDSQHSHVVTPGCT